jgi:hypothetical protein
MLPLWECLAALEGQTLTTVTGRSFLVQGVRRDGVGSVVVVPERTGVSRRISGREFESADRLGLIRDDVTPSQLRKAKVSERNPRTSLRS